MIELPPGSDDDDNNSNPRNEFDPLTFLTAGTKDSKNKSLIPMYLTRYILSKNRFISISESMVYRYNDGIYERYWDMIDSYVHKTFVEVSKSNEFYASTQIINETVSRISRETRKEASAIESKPNLICLKNKVLNITTGEVLDHSPDMVFLNKIPITYNPSARCPNFDKFLNEVVSKEDALTVYELLGYLLHRGYPIQKAFMFVGEGSNGKSTLIRVMNSFIGGENISNLSLQDICNEKFAVSNLHTKLLNSCADLKESELSDTGMFKMVTGNDMLSADIKGKERISFINYAKLVFSCNKVPLPKDSSYAYLRRWMVIKFNHKFEGNNDNKNLINEITTPEELSGILNKALEGLKYLLEKGRFSFRYNEQEEISRLFAPVKYFVDTECFMSFNAKVMKGTLFHEYREFCKKHNMSLMTDKSFGKTLNEYVNLTEGRISELGVQHEAWFGIRLKTESEKKPKSEEELEDERYWEEQEKKHMEDWDVDSTIGHHG